MERQVKNFLEIIKYAIHNPEREGLPELMEPVDFHGLAMLAKKHNLYPLFHEVICRFPEYRNQPDYEQNVYLAMTMLAQQVKKTDSFLNLYRAFLAANLHPIVMKGIICRQLYGKYGEYRPSGDEDILVRKEEFFQAKAVLEELGYECERPDVTEAQLELLQEVAFYEKESRFLIEVHTNVMGHENELRTRMGDCFQNVFENARVCEVNEVPLTTMSHTEHYLFLVLHAFKHFTLNGVGVRQMMDILLYQEQFGTEIDWEYVETALRENHAAGYLGDLQYIGVTYLGCSLPIQYETCAPESLLEDMVEVGVFGKRGEADELAGRINLNSKEGKQSAIRTWIRAGFPSREFMINKAPHLREKPWLLPVEWVKRWGRFLKKSKKYDGNLMMDGIKKSRKRMELLKKYGL